MAKKALQSLDDKPVEEKKQDFDVRFCLNGGGTMEIVSPITAFQLYRELMETIAQKSNNISFTGWYAFKDRQGKFRALNIMSVCAIEEV